MMFVVRSPVRSEGSQRSLPPRANALVVGVALFLSACGSPVQYWTPPSAPKENRVERISFGHSVLFQGNSAALSNGERFKFEKFLNEIGLGFADDIQIGVVGSTGASAQVAEKRVDAIGSFFRSRGIVYSEVPAIPQGTWDGSVSITVGRYVVIPPSCPNWEKDPGYDFNNTEMSNLGCPTATNLGLMIADPGDLVRSRSVGAGDGTTLARSVQNFRTGRIAKAGASVSGSADPESAKTSAGAESRTEGGGGN